MDEVSKFRLDFTDMKFGRKKYDVVFAAGAFGEPGFDLWIGEKCLFLTMINVLDFRDLMNARKARAVVSLGNVLFDGEDVQVALVLTTSNDKLEINIGNESLSFERDRTNYIREFLQDNYGSVNREDVKWTVGT